MALPVYRNFTYYRGNTYTERLYPKNADGTPMALKDEDDVDFLAYFYIDTDRDGNATTAGTISLDSAASTVTYTITPAVGLTLIAGATYIYEITIKNQATGETYTLVTGNITVSGNVKTVL